MEKSEKWTSTSEAGYAGNDEILIAQAATKTEQIPSDTTTPLSGSSPNSTNNSTVINTDNAENNNSNINMEMAPRTTHQRLRCAGSW